MVTKWLYSERQIRIQAISPKPCRVGIVIIMVGVFPPRL